MANNQGRAPPAYQEYAATILASRVFRLSSLIERGLLYTMKLELWVNETLPADPGPLSKILGLDPDDVAAALPNLMTFFAVENGQVSSPELDGYREHLETRHLKLSAGGKVGAAATNGGKRKVEVPKAGSRQGFPVDTSTSPATLTATPPAIPSASPRPLSTVQPSTTKSKPASMKELVLDPWVADYIAAELPAGVSGDAYRKVSRGA